MAVGPGRISCSNKLYSKHVNKRSSFECRDSGESIEATLNALHELTSKKRTPENRIPAPMCPRMSLLPLLPSSSSWVASCGAPKSDHGRKNTIEIGAKRSASGVY